MATDIQYHYNKHLPFIKEGTKGNVYIDGEYCNDQDKDRLPVSRMMQWMVTANPQRSEKQRDTWAPEVITGNDFLQNQGDAIVWLGHASFFIRFHGKNILTDPVLYDLAPVLRRRHALPCKPEALTGIDYILLSHGHRDHLDIPSLTLLAGMNPGVVVLCPLGFEKILRNIGFRHVQEAAWWQQYTMVKGLDITFLPAKHWNRRWLWDYNTTLWGSFWLQHSERTIYFAGDSAYSSHFTTIRRQLGAPQVCLLPVGAYKPEYVMKWAHTSPKEAHQAFLDLQGGTFIPMHFGTFDLSDEPASEPLRLTRQLFADDHRLHQLKAPAVGEMVGF
jgi:L-ascorbate metabolism protein UlaG (beta-lactamase superfamily)